MPVDESYRKQVSPLLKIVPLVAKETVFALKGGTAINLFLRNMPRLSVAIDLTYLPIKDRESSLKEIDAAMRRIAKQIERGVPGAKVSTSGPKGEKAITKLIVRDDGAQIKIEVTPVLRGCVYEPTVRSVSLRVEEEFGFAEPPARKRPYCFCRACREEAVARSPQRECPRRRALAAPGKQQRRLASHEPRKPNWRPNETSTNAS